MARKPFDGKGFTAGAMGRMGWSAAQYSKFIDDRTRPARDLLHAVPLEDPGLVIDLGCGPGNSTALLARRFPKARILGIDSDPEMLAAARRRLPECEFLAARIEDWQPAEPPDLIFANASLQWVDDHRALIPRLLGFLSDEGSLAVQMPDNLDEASHRAIRHVAADPRWSARMEAADARRKPLIPPRDLHALLRPHAARVDIWRTVYQHELGGAGAIVEWFKGSALRPYLARLDPTEEAQFLLAYREEVAASYPETAGLCLLPFPRCFFVATRGGA